MLPIKRTYVLYAAALAISPLALLALNHSWIYIRVDSLDPWIYAGYHLHPHFLLKAFPKAYFGTRVPWTALGWAIHRVAGAEASLYILAFILIYASTWSVFHSIRLLFNNAAAAFVSASFLGTSPWLLWSFGWTYIDGPTIACMYLTIAAMAETSSGRRWRSAATLCGATVAAFVFLTLTYIVFLPVLLLLFIALNHLGNRRPLGHAVLYWVAGATIFTLFMGLANWLLGGNPIFFLPELPVASNLLGRQIIERTDDFWQPWNQWIWSSSWLLLPAIGALASAALLTMRGPVVLRALREGDAGRDVLNKARFIAVAVTDIVMTAFFAVMQAFHLSMLEYDFRANALLPFASLALGGCIAIGLPRVRGVPTLALVLATPLLSALPWLPGVLEWVERQPLYMAAATIPVSAPLVNGPIREPLWALIGGALFVALFLSRSSILTLGVIAFVGMMDLAILGTANGIHVPATALSRDRTLAVYDAAALIDASLPVRTLSFWWSANDTNQLLFGHVGAMYIWFNNPLPLVAGERVVLLSTNTSLLAAELHELKQRHLKLVGSGDDHIARGAVDFDLEIRDVAAIESVAR